MKHIQKYREVEWAPMNPASTQLHHPGTQSKYRVTCSSSPLLAWLCNQWQTPYMFNAHNLCLKDKIAFNYNHNTINAPKGRGNFFKTSKYQLEFVIVSYGACIFLVF